MNWSRLVCALAAGLCFLQAAARGDAVAPPGPNQISSASGQTSPQASQPRKVAAASVWTTGA